MDALKEGSPVCGSAYFINDREPVFLYEWINTLLAELHIPKIEAKIAYNSAYRLASVIEWAYRLLPLSGEPPLTRFVVANLATSHSFSIQKACKELGYSPVVTPDEAFHALVEYLKNKGLQRLLK